MTTHNQQGCIVLLNSLTEHIPSITFYNFYNNIVYLKKKQIPRVLAASKVKYNAKETSTSYLAKDKEHRRELPSPSPKSPTLHLCYSYIIMIAKYLLIEGSSFRLSSAQAQHVREQAQTSYFKAYISYQP